MYIVGVNELQYNEDVSASMTCMIASLYCIVDIVGMNELQYNVDVSASMTCIRTSKS